MKEKRKNVKTDAERIQQLKAEQLPDSIVNGTKGGEIMDLLNVEKGRTIDLGLTREHNMCEFAKSADARDGSHVYAKRSHEQNGDVVRSRLAATQLAIGDSLDVTHHRPPLMMVRVLLATASRYVDEHEAHDRVHGFAEVSVVFYHAKVDKLVYVHPPRGTCQLGVSLKFTKQFICWKLKQVWRGIGEKAHSSEMVRQPWKQRR